MNRFIISFLLLSILGVGNLYASHALKNSLEGKSQYLTKKIQEQISSYGFDDDSLKIQDTFALAVNESKLCSSIIHTTLSKDLGYSAKKVKSLYYYLRSINEIDDISLKIFLKQIPLHGTVKQNSSSKQLEIKYFNAFEKLIVPQAGKIRCEFSDISKLLVRLMKDLEVEKAKKLTTHLKTYLAQKPELEDILRPLILLSKNYKKPVKLALREYVSLKSEIRKQITDEVFEQMQTQEKSEYASEYLKKEKRTRRQKLYESYTFIQLILLKDIISELKRDLEAVRMEYVLYDALGGVVDTYTMDPMEQFCFTIKLMRKKLYTLNENFFFASRSGNFEDSMMAAVEFGVISTYEFDSVFGFKEIWDPQKSFWDKNRKWIQTFGSLTGVVLPPPFGAIPMLAIMGIESVRQVRSGGQANESHNVCRMSNEI